MIIDIHGHVSAPQGLYAYKAGLLAARGSHGKGGGRYTDEQIEQALNAKSVFGDGHLEQLRKHGADLQLLSPRPFQMMHSERPGAGSYQNPELGHAFDHVRPYVEQAAGLSDADRKLIFEDNAKAVFKLEL